jgi:aryl-alcohol dehydrogenase-like predicted oxidoreductase
MTNPMLNRPTRVSVDMLDVFPLCLGTNIFGWTVDEHDAFALLDAFVGVGGNFIDTADRYSEWVEGNSGGESETIIGRWLNSRRCRDKIVVATKVGALTRHRGLAPDTVRSAVEGSLQRLGTDHIDLLYAHRDDESISVEDALGGFDELVREGKVASIGVSNFSATRLAAWLEASERLGLARLVAVQPLYNLLDREQYENDLAALCEAEGIACIPYAGLAQGFLTGKYRSGRELPQGARSNDALSHLDARGIAVLEVLDDVAAAHATTVAAVALAWLRGRPAVVAPIASARTPEQLCELLPMVELGLSRDEADRLDAVSLERTSAISHDELER